MDHTKAARAGRSRLLIGSTLAAMLVALATPALAAAAKPVSEPVSMRPTFVLPAGYACEFDLGVTVQANRETYKLWLDADGNPTRGHLSGRLVLEMTNLDSGTSTVVKASGPAADAFNADGTIDTAYLGRGVPLFDGIFYLSVGRAEFNVTYDFDLVAVGRSSGRAIDICGLLS